MRPGDPMRAGRAAPGGSVALLALATAVPRFVILQGEAEALAARVFRAHPALFERLRPAFANAGIDRRFSCVPLEWYLSPHGWPERTALYVEHAMALCEAAARGCLERAGMAPDCVDAVVTVSSTGVATPSLDARLVDRLGLRQDVVRLPVFGLGCAGGALGLARASALAAAMPGRRVLFLTVELCGLNFREADVSRSNVIATALFGDGAAGALLCTEGDGPRITGAAERTWPGTLDVMGWRVEADGLGVVFSQDIPTLIRQRLRPAAEAALAGQGLSLSQIDRFVCHPGGTKVVQALEAAFDLAEGGLDSAREILRSYGNMSAPTVLFVLERVLAEARGRPARHLLTAMGPGFSAGFVTLEER